MTSVSTLLLLCIAVKLSKTENNEFHKLFLDSLDEWERKFYFGDEEKIECEIIPLSLDSSERISVVKSVESVTKHLKFKAFDQTIELNLYPNEHIIAPKAKVVKTSKNSSTILKINNTSCHYLHADNFSTASINICDAGEVRGLIFLSNDTLEILPLSLRLQSLLRLDETTEAKPHIVKKSFFGAGSFENDFLQSRDNDYSNSKPKIQTPIDRPTVELGLFFDESFYTHFAKFFEYNDEKLNQFILHYVNSVQSLYHHRSLGRKIDFTIVFIEIMEEQSAKMPHAYGEREALIDNFCQYQKNQNFNDDKTNIWDLSVYVSALDFFAWDENGVKSSATMGLATVGGVCQNDYNCIITEFGAVNHFGKPYPSSGFTAVYILAHEIGHSLGISHDSIGNHCSKDGYIMSATRGTVGETTWSKCSSDVIKKIDLPMCLFDKSPKHHNNYDLSEYNGHLGLIYTAKAQCEVLLRDNDAYDFYQDQKSICENLHCRTPKRPGIFFSGPALQGTACGLEKWCNDGSCMEKPSISTPAINGFNLEWGPWTENQCKSYCLMNGKGVKQLLRKCHLPNLQCEGSSESVKLCDDQRICVSKRSVENYGTQKCKEFSKNVSQIDPSGMGLQASYDGISRLWMPCVIFCKRKYFNSYYAARTELNNLGIDPYYPDGTFCHREGKENFYCLQHHCLPESTLLMKILDLWDDDDHESVSIAPITHK